ncbi:hypothetical protein, partial [Human papillomavirus 138]
NIKIQLFLLLLLPVLVAPPGTPHPGRAPTPWDNRKLRRASGDKDHLPPVPPDVLDRVRGRATGTPSLARRRLENHLRGDDDEDENKENQLPNEEEATESHHLGSLLKKWGEDIDLLKEKILQDLDNCKKKLGIPQCCC